MRSLTLLVAAMIAGLLFLALRVGRPHEVAPPPAIPSTPAEPPAVLGSPPDQRTMVEPAPLPAGAITGPLPAGQITAREYLAGYYGERWPEIERGIKSNLDQPLFLAPWEEVEASFAEQLPLEPGFRADCERARLDWCDPLTAQWLHERFPMQAWDGSLEEFELQEIALLVEPVNEELRALSKQFLDRTESYLQEMWQRGTYVRAPFTTEGLTGMGYFSKSIGSRGWALTFTLTFEQCPDIKQNEDEMRALWDQRDLLVMRYLRQRLHH